MPQNKPEKRRPVETRGSDGATKAVAHGIGPVDRMRFGMRLAEIIMRARNLCKRCRATDRKRLQHPLAVEYDFRTRLVFLMLFFRQGWASRAVSGKSHGFIG